MSNARPVQMLLVGIVAALAFFMQSSSCFAERAGFFPCHEHAVDNSCTDSHEGDDADCCHVESTALLTEPFPTTPLSLSEVDYFVSFQGTPEGPIEEIDYPPQLLS